MFYITLEIKLYLHYKKHGKLTIEDIKKISERHNNDPRRYLCVF